MATVSTITAFSNNTIADPTAVNTNFNNLKSFCEGSPIHVDATGWTTLTGLAITFPATKLNGLVPLANGGTNASTAATARTNLGVPGVGSSGIFTASNTITVSTATATGGNNGDIWIKI